MDTNNELSTEVVQDDLTRAIEDEYGALYSEDGKRLLKIKNKELSEYSIKDGTEVVCDGAFNGCGTIKNVNIPGSVKMIGDSAFAKCTGLTGITIPNSVEVIGDRAFSNCTGLKRVTTPDSMVTMGYGAFWGCTELTEMAIPYGVTETIRTFYGCTKLGKVAIPDGVTEIGYQAFRDCKGLTQLKIPDSVTEIGNSAFFNCTGLTRINIPDSVTIIRGWAFAKCEKLTRIDIGNGVTEIGEAAFLGCKGLMRVTIGSDMTKIDDFIDCISLVGIEVSKNNKYYCSKDGVLYSKDMKKLIRVPKSSPIFPEFRIPDGVTEICSEAFYGCMGLDKVTIPASVTTIGDEAFNECVIEFDDDGNDWEDYSDLEEIISLNPEPPICEGLDYEWAKHTYILYVPKGSKEAYSSADGWKLIRNIREIEIENTGKCPTDASDENNANSFQNCIIPNIPYEKVNEIKEFLVGEGITNVEGLHCEFGGRLGFINYWDKCLLVNKYGEMVGGPFDRIILLSDEIALCMIYKGTHFYGGERTAIFDKQLIVDFNGKVMTAVEGSGEIEMVSKSGNVLLLKQKRFTDYEISQIRDNVNIERNRCTCPHCNEKLGRSFFFDRPEDGRLECSRCRELVLGYEIKDFIDCLPALNKIHILSALNFSETLKAAENGESDFSEYTDYYDDQFTSIKSDETAFKYLEEVTNQELYSMFSLVSRKCLIPFQPNKITIGNSGIYIQTDIDRIRNCDGHPYSKKYAKDKYSYTYNYGDDELFFEGEVAEHIDYTFVEGPCLGLTLLQAFKKKYKTLLRYLYSRSLQIGNEAVSELMAICGRSKQKIRGLIFAKDVAFNFGSIDSSSDLIYAIIKCYSVYSSKIIEGELVPFYYDLSFYDVFKKDPRYILYMVRSGRLSISDDVLDEVSDLEGYSELLEIVQYLEAERRAQEEYERDMQYSRECESDVRQARRDFEDMMNDFDAWGNID